MGVGEAVGVAATVGVGIPVGVPPGVGPEVAVALEVAVGLADLLGLAVAPRIGRVVGDTVPDAPNPWPEDSEDPPSLGCAVAVPPRTP